MSTTLIEIRRARTADASEVAETHDEAWRAAYQGIIPGNELDKLIARLDHYKQVDRHLTGTAMH